MIFKILELNFFLVWITFFSRFNGVGFLISIRIFPKGLLDSDFNNIQFSTDCLSAQNFANAWFGPAFVA